MAIMILSRIVIFVSLLVGVGCLAVNLVTLSVRSAILKIKCYRRVIAVMYV
jgi:hypothetical protein